MKQRIKKMDVKTVLLALGLLGWGFSFFLCLSLEDAWEHVGY